VKTLWIENPIFRVKTLFVKATEKEYDKLMAKMGLVDSEKAVGNDAEGWVESAQTKEHGPFEIVWVAHNRHIPHEVSHLVDRIFRHHNIHTGYKTTEVRALLTSFYENVMCEALCN
jgi:hypothetical protein